VLFGFSVIVINDNFSYAPYMKRILNWPPEQAKTHTRAAYWQHAPSNICLDFHGDPLKARLTVFSDGNHHMALQEILALFLQQHPGVNDVFYATTPPNVLISYLENGGLNLGNLRLSRLPHVFISPSNVMNKLVNEDFINSHRAFIQSKGNVLLVRKENPKKINGIVDLLRDDVRLFISNPQTERASYEVYRDTLIGLAQEQGLESNLMGQKLTGKNSNIIFGERIHHREAPQALYEDQADVAMVYYHLALRYTRIFPDDFEIVFPSSGAEQTVSTHIITTYHAGLLSDAGDWGTAFLDFLFSDQVTDIYQFHGLSRP